MPARFSDNPELGIWVRTQRGQRLKMLKERASKLDSIGFTWNRNLDVRWDIMFEKLRKCKEREGHCSVRYSENPELSNWVSNQRSNRLKISKEELPNLIPLVLPGLPKMVNGR